MDKKKLLLIALVFSNFILKGQELQKRHLDTTFIYETIIVYDTLYIYDTIRITPQRTSETIEFIKNKQPDFFLLQYDTLNQNANLLIISKHQSATIPINYIMYNENIQNSTNMKKLNFLGIMLFVFQSIVMAQSEFGISAGGGTWWTNCNKSVVTREFTPAFNIGFFYKIPINKTLKLNAALNYHFLTNNYGYKSDEVYLMNIQWNGEEQEAIQTLNSMGDAESGVDYHQFSIPVTLGYTLGKFEPHLGLEYSFRFANAWFNNHNHLLGLYVGLHFSITEKIGISLNYNRGLTNDYNFKIYKRDINIEENKEIIVSLGTCKWKSNRIGLSLCYKFNQN